jgi:hypothetical protein
MKENPKQFAEEVIFLIGVFSFVWTAFYIASVW